MALVTLAEILDAWDSDQKLDIDEPGKEAQRIPFLHARYLRWWSLEKAFLNELNKIYKQLFFAKQEYYIEGPANLQEYEEKKKMWKTVPDRNRTVLRAAVDRYLDADLDILEIRKKMDESQLKIDSLEMILKQIMNRGYQVTNIIEWHKWSGGG